MSLRRSTPLKEQPGRDIAVFAGAGVAQSFLDLDLLDEYRLVINPIILGAGTPLFAEHAGQPMELRLVETSSFVSGAVMHANRPAR